MKINKVNTLKKCLFLTFIIIAITVVISLVIRYDVEGEDENSLPYYIQKIRIVSTVGTKSNEDPENLWNINLTENNNIFIDIAKNEKSSNETIKEIKLDNFTIKKAPKLGNVVIYRPTGDWQNLYEHSEQNYLKSNITYTGARVDTLKTLEIRNAGGMMGFRVSLENLGNYISNNDTEEIVYDGSLLKKANISKENINFTLAFDITITLNNNISYKGSNITLDFPCSDITSEKEPFIELTDFSNVVFKRLK